MDNLISFLIAAVVIGSFLLYYLRQEKKKEIAALAASEKGKLRSDGPQSQHPHIENNYCIGCATCTMRVEPGADPRSGRWAGTGKTECGLHT